MPFKSAGPVRYWRPDLVEAVKHRFLRNAGDELGPRIVTSILARRDVDLRAWNRPGSALWTVGSVVQLARAGDVVWGAGLRGMEVASSVRPSIDVRAVRGPLTAEAVRKQIGVECKVFGDPGLLVPSIFGRPTGSSSNGVTRVLFISHFADSRTSRSFRHLRMIGDPARILAEICAHDVVISSALHGIILAEAYGKPTVWLGGIDREPEFKYLDYYGGTGRDSPRCCPRIEQWENYVNPAARFSADALIAAFPYDCFAANAGRATTPPLS